MCQAVGASQYTRQAMRTALVSAQKNAELIVVRTEMLMPQVLNRSFVSCCLYARSVYVLMIRQAGRGNFNPVAREGLLSEKVLRAGYCQRPAVAPGLSYADMGTRSGKLAQPPPRPFAPSGPRLGPSSGPSGAPWASLWAKRQCPWSP